MIPSGGVEVLGPRALNRALLARQFLLERSRCPVPGALTHLVGLQAQSPDAPYYGLWSRLAGFHPDQLCELIISRRAVRATMLRGTIHLVTAEDCVALRALVEPTMERVARTETDYDGQQVHGLPVAEVLAVGAELLAERPMTAAELREAFRARWPDHDPEPVSRVARALIPLVQVPPRGTWHAGGPARLSPVEHWLGQSVRPDPEPAALVPRYLAAFGPATAADLATWSGLTGVRELLDGLRPTLRVFADERGRELFDLPEAPRPDPDTPAPVRFVAPYDNVQLGHADRARIVPEHYRRVLLTKNGVVPGTVLVDGFVAGSWELNRRGRRMSVRLFRSPGAEQLAEVHHEAGRLAAFAGVAEPVVAVDMADMAD